jgi:zinc protease
MRTPTGNPRRALGLALALALAPGLAAARGDDRTPKVPDLKVQKYTLPNGLEVILHEDHTIPVVAVNLWYRVGSKDEKPHRTGFAHLFEHLMFKGSLHHDSEYFSPIESVGADANGSTTQDRTNYYEALPSNALERALWLESDRMGFLLPALTQAKLDNQRDVVKNERRQSVDNEPYGQSEEKIAAALYPPDHPYHHSVIGSMADLSAARLADVSAFFRTYYAPNNASLCVAGDLDPAKTKALIAKYFGPIPRGPEVARPKPDVPKLDAPKRLAMTDRVTLPRATLVWPTVPVNHPDEKPLDVLATVLGRLVKENRLYRALVYDRQLAAAVSADQDSRMLAGEFQVDLSARPDQALDPIVAIADAEIARLKAEGPTAEEVHKAQSAYESRLVLGIQAFEARADFLNANNVESSDPLAYKDHMKKLFAVTPADVKRVAEKYLTANRVRLDVTPGPPTPRAPEVAVAPGSQAPTPSPPAVAVRDDFDRSKMPPVGPPPKFTPPAVVRRKLSNGLELRIAERHDLPILSVELAVKGGETLAPADRIGLASLTASLLREGTATRDALTLAGDLDVIGASLWAEGDLESSSIGITTLTNHTAPALGLFTDVLLRPSFPQAELDRLKARRLAAIRARGDSAPSVASLVLPKLIYGASHPYGRPFGSRFSPNPGTEATVGAITRGEVVSFYERVYRPGNSSLIVVGDANPDAITADLEKALGGWKARKGETAAPPAPPVLPRGITVSLVDKPDAAQSYLAVGEVGVSRRTPDYAPLTVLNAVLGGQFSSRINLNLREDKGYTYWAYSAFSFRLGPGPFTAAAAVQTDVTKDALAELVKELTDLVGRRPVTKAEFDFAKDRLVRGFPSQFATTFDVAQTLSDLVLYDLPDDEFTTYPARV